MKEDDEVEDQEKKKKKKKKKSGKTGSKTKIPPLGDCIQVEYNDQFELTGFSLRSKVVQHIYSKTKDLHTLKELIKAIIYMNKLMASFSGVSDVKETKKQTVHMKIVQNNEDELGEQEIVYNKVPLYEHYENQEGVLSDSGFQTMENITENSISPI